MLTSYFELHPYIARLFVTCPSTSMSLQGTLEVMHAMETLDLIGIQKGLVKVTQSLKKMRETFKLMHGKSELNWAQYEFNQFTC